MPSPRSERGHPGEFGDDVELAAMSPPPQVVGDAAVDSNADSDAATPEERAAYLRARYGTVLELWLCALATMPTLGMAVPFVWAATRRMSLRSGSLLGGGMALSLAAVLVFILMEVGAIAVPSRAVGAVPLLIALLVGPVSIYQGLGGWVIVSRRTYSTQIDVIVVVLVSLVLIVGLVYTLVRGLLTGLLQAM